MRFLALEFMPHNIAYNSLSWWGFQIQIQCSIRFVFSNSLTYALQMIIKHYQSLYCIIWFISVDELLVPSNFYLHRYIRMTCSIGRQRLTSNFIKIHFDTCSCVYLTKCTHILRLWRSHLDVEFHQIVNGSCHYIMFASNGHLIKHIGPIRICIYKSILSNRHHVSILCLIP